MGAITKIFFTTFSLCMMAVVFMNKNHQAFQNNRELPNNSKETSFISMPSDLRFEKKAYRFNDPDMAYKVLSELDVFLPTAGGKLTERKLASAFLGLTKRADYCNRHRAYVVEYPQSIFEEMNFFIEETTSSFIRSVALKPLGNDIHPNIASNMPLKQQGQQLYDLRPFVNIYFTKNDMQPHMDVGKHFSCLTQEYNHIPGHSVLARKDLVAKAVMEYAENFKDRPQCFNYNKFFPKTWLLNNEDQCKEFFKKLNSKQYKRLKAERRIVYIRKVARGSHRGEGVQPVTDQEEAELRRDYDNGKNCGKVTKNYLVQNYLHNPLLLDGHKFDFRMYMLIASTNPLIAYYHDGFLRVTLANYDVNSTEKKVLLTNLALNKQVYDDVKDGKLYEGKDEESLKLSQQWSFDRLQTYLLENGIINDENWLDNYLRPEFKKAMIHLLRLSSGNFMKHSSLYELYGVDFMLDSNLNLWFIEANSGPAFKGYSEPMEKFVLGMLKDHLEIVTGLLRSRMKRIVNYVNEIIDDGAAQEVSKGKVIIDGLEERREKFQEITSNYFEEEFEPEPTNGFSKIIDENYYGVQRYRGLVREECL